MTPAIGHNNGPTMEPGHGWRSHCWTQARKSLLGHLPIEVVRSQVKRAAEIGLDYKTYATVTGTSGQDNGTSKLNNLSFRYLTLSSLPSNAALSKFRV